MPKMKEIQKVVQKLSRDQKSASGDGASASSHDPYRQFGAVKIYSHILSPVEIFIIILLADGPTVIQIRASASHNIILLSVVFVLTHRPWEDAALILKFEMFKQMAGLISLSYPAKLPIDECLRTYIMPSQHWFR